MMLLLHSMLCGHSLTCYCHRVWEVMAKDLLQKKSRQGPVVVANGKPNEHCRILRLLIAHHFVDLCRYMVASVVTPARTRLLALIAFNDSTLFMLSFVL